MVVFNVQLYEVLVAQLKSNVTRNDNLPSIYELRTDDLSCAIRVGNVLMKMLKIVEHH